MSNEHEELQKMKKARELESAGYIKLFYCCFESVLGSRKGHR